MTTAEHIFVGVKSLIVLIGWLRWVGEGRSHDGGMPNHHPTSPPKYQRPLSIIGSDVRFGSKADIEAAPVDIRFTRKSEH